MEDTDKGVLGREIMNARMWRTGTILVLLLSLVTLAGWGQGVAPKGIIPTPPESTALQVSIWVDRGAYAVGESITIHYSVNKPAYVYIWDITPDGQANQFFPNSLPGGSNNYVTAGEHTVPGNWQVAPPLGTEYLQILATTSPVDPFAAFTGDPQALQAQVQAQILGILPVTERTWNFTSFDIVQGSVPSYGRLNITSTPAGASIYIDEEYVGYTPRSVYAPAGFRRVALVMPGYQTWQNSIYVIGGLTRTINVNLVGSAPSNLPPVSVFVWTPPTPGVGEWVQFNGAASTDPDGSIASHSWSFGDGSTGTGSVIWHRFLSGGNYTVTLTVTDNRGASVPSSQTVRVGSANQQPVAAFSNDPAIGTPGGWMQFDASASYDLDGAIGSYAWSFGDGTTGTGSVIWHRYSSVGSYVVSLTVTDNLGAPGVLTRTIQVGSTNLPPSASFTVLPPAPSVAAWARFDATASTDADGSIVSYQWTFGDGATATGNVVYHQFTSAGTFPVTLTVTDNGGATNSTTQPVQVGTPMQAPVASFTFSPSSPIVGSPVVFNASSSYDPDGVIVSYQWDLNGDGTVDTNGVTGQVTYSSPGAAVVRLTVTDNSGLSTSTTQTIVVSLSGGGSSSAPAMGTTAGFFVWGSDTWHVTVNAGAGWIAPHNYRIELRTDGQFSGLNESWSGGVAPLGIVPTPATSGKTLILEGSIQAGSVDYTFTIPGSTTMWMSFKMDQNGDGTLEESTSFVYLRYRMVRPPANPFVVGLPSGTSGSLIPSLNFRLGTAWTYTETTRFVFWSTTIGALESL